MRRSRKLRRDRPWLHLTKKVEHFEARFAEMRCLQERRCLLTSSNSIARGFRVRREKDPRLGKMQKGACRTKVVGNTRFPHRRSLASNNFRVGDNPGTTPLMNTERLSLSTNCTDTSY